MPMPITTTLLIAAFVFADVHSVGVGIGCTIAAITNEAFRLLVWMTSRSPAQGDRPVEGPRTRTIEPWGERGSE